MYLLNCFASELQFVALHVICYSVYPLSRVIDDV